MLLQNSEVIQGSRRHKFTERDISINEMYSRTGKATENMHLPLANVKKLKREQYSSNSNVVKRDQKAPQIQNQKPVSIREIEEHFKLLIK